MIGQWAIGFSNRDNIAQNNGEYNFLLTADTEHMETYSLR